MKLYVTLVYSIIYMYRQEDMQSIVWNLINHNEKLLPYIYIDLRD